MAKRDFPTIDKHQYTPPINTPPADDVKTDDVEEDNTVAKAAELIFGTVTDCARLNIRLEPRVSASILCVVNAGTELIIDPDKSTDDWYSVTTNVGADGFCMKKYVSVQ